MAPPPDSFDDSFKGNLAQLLRTVDVFPKVADDFQSKTSHGGSVTIICAAIISCLIISEIYWYSHPVIKHKMYVDVAHTDKLRINVNITFPKLPCAFLSLDTLDSSGEHQLNVIKNFEKTRLDKDGRVSTTPEKELSSFLKDLPRPGGHTSAFHTDHVRISTDGSSEDAVTPQKNTEAQSKAIQDAAEFMSEGCNMAGFLKVAKVAGNFHFSLHGTSHYVLGALYPDLFSIDVSHIISELSFGIEVPGTKNPLDGVDRTSDSGSGTYQYYLKIVPTVYEYGGSELLTNQYSVTEHFKGFREPDDGHGHSYQGDLPAVYFIYELSPIMVRVTRGRPPLGTFVATLSAIVGGVFTVAGIVDTGISFAINYISSRSKATALGT